MYFDFMVNLIIVLFFCGVAILIDKSINKKYVHYVLGIIFGLIIIFVVNSKIVIVEGYTFNCSHIIMTMAGFIGGPITAAIAAIIGSIYKYHLSGSNSITGITVIMVFGVIGSILGKFLRYSQNGKKFLFLFLIGLAMTAILLPILAFIPSWRNDSAIVLRIVAGPLFLVTPLATTIIFNFYYWADSFFSNASILNTILNFSPINLIIFDTNRPVLLSENLKKQPQLSRLLENSSLLMDNAKNCQNDTQQHQEIVTEDGNYFDACLSGVKMPSGQNACVTILRDITDKKKEEEKLKKIQAEVSRLDRLNLVGQMAAGIGHEIRNPMTTVRGYLQLLGAKPEYSSQRSAFELMISELDRANSIITEFLALSRTRPSKLENKSLNSIIIKLYPLLEADAVNQDKQISFYSTKLPYIQLDEEEISQLILNLTRNGLESMKDNGILAIETYVDGNNVVLKVKDKGCGIPPENLDKLGTPFFTTKGYGTGLGLATCYRIAESHSAKIEVDSNNEGTSFYVRFPMSQEVILEASGATSSA